MLILSLTLTGIGNKEKEFVSLMLEKRWHFAAFFVVLLLDLAVLFPLARRVGSYMLNQWLQAQRGVRAAKITAPIYACNGPTATVDVGFHGK